MFRGRSGAVRGRAGAWCRRLGLEGSCRREGADHGEQVFETHEREVIGRGEQGKLKFASVSGGRSSFRSTTAPRVVLGCKLADLTPPGIVRSDDADGLSIDEEQVVAAAFVEPHLSHGDAFSCREIEPLIVLHQPAALLEKRVDVFTSHFFRGRPGRAHFIRS